MKKTMTTMVALLMMLTLGCSALAQAYYTLPEVREQAKVGWHRTYTDKYGRETVVDIDLQVFGRDIAPVLKVNRPSYENEKRDDGWYIKKVNYPYNDLTDAKRKRGGETKYFYEQGNGKSVDLDTAYGKEYGNELTLREAYAILEADIVLRGKSPEDYCWEQPAEFNMICGVHKKTGEVISPAFYAMDLWSEMYGLPIMARACDSFYNSLQAWYNSNVMYVVRSENEYGIFDRSLTVEEILAQDIPLCSVEMIVKGIEERIKSGHIQEVYSLRFGYSIYCDPTVPYNQRANGLEADCYYLVPSWVLECEYMTEPKKNYDRYEGRSSLTINAQTGEFIGLKGRATKDMNASYAGFIPWDEIK